MQKHYPQGNVNDKTEIGYLQLLPEPGRENGNESLGMTMHFQYVQQSVQANHRWCQLKPNHHESELAIMPCCGAGRHPELAYFAHKDLAQKQEQSGNRTPLPSLLALTLPLRILPWGETGSVLHRASAALLVCWIGLKANSGSPLLDDTSDKLPESEDSRGTVV